MAEAGILHVDMDSFYVSVEVLDDPSLKGRPVIVGGTGDRGVVASCSYEARVHGVHSAMPSLRARRLCPQALFLPGRFDRYQQESRAVFEIFRSFTPLVEGISLDEAFLDVRGARRLHGPPVEIAWAIRRRVAEERGLPCSVGVASVKMLAKLASEAAKPRIADGRVVPGEGVHVVEPGTELEFLHPLPVRALWGVGPATQRRLDRFGVKTVGDLAGVSLQSLVRALGDAQGRHLHDLARAHDPRPVVADRAVKSIGHEETYAHDHHSVEALGDEAVRLADGVAARLRQGNLTGRTVTVKVRFSDFRTITRSRTVERPLETGGEIAAVARVLLADVDPSPGVRLLGVSVSGLGPLARQLSFEEVAGRPAAGAAGAVDAIRARFGEGAIGPGTLLDRDGLRLRRTGDTRWGPERGQP